MEHRASHQSLRKVEKARLRQEAYLRRARIAKKWGRRCLCLMVVSAGVVAWQDPALGPKIQMAVADAAHAADVYFGGDGNARDMVVAALPDIRS
ncbi:hypothetical protein [uncultured Roseovarius sp.]|uniref:hypothetical protein n=1 Tax=uncultured Roseovarius sp. TaxID=293344 RepID=UPI0026009CB1|nr:hypothetical protein [uncultured Roseovarius sp.]